MPIVSLSQKQGGREPGPFFSLSTDTERRKARSRLLFNFASCRAAQGVQWHQ